MTFFGLIVAALIVEHGLCVIANAIKGLRVRR